MGMKIMILSKIKIKTKRKKTIHIKLGKRISLQW